MIIYNLDLLRFRVPIYVPKQFLRIMKLTIIIMTAFLLQVSAGTYAQKITLNEKNASLEHIITTIRSQSGYDFIGSAKLIKSAKPVSINVKQISLDEALKICFQNQDLTYSIEDKTVVIRLKEKSVLDRVVDYFSLIKITGTVTDSKGSPLPGVLVSIKGNAYKSATNAQGKYIIPAAEEQAILVFSMLGFATQEVNVAGRKVINVELIESDTKLDEVVVVGYGSVQKKDLTGSVGLAKVSDMNKAPVASFDQALAGRIAGVNVSSNDGQPGNENNIVIRGGNSLTQSSAPLYVIDGFPMEDFSSAAVSPEDIASISVLKDASATAIYGSRGANGVIVIETKKGVSGKPAINYKGSLGFQQATNKMDMMKPYDFVKYQQEIYPTLAERYYLDDVNMTLDDYKTKKGYDWQNSLFRTAPIHIHNLSVRGGNSSTKYSISGMVYDQKGVIINSAYKRYQGRMSIDQTISKKLKAGATVALGKMIKSGSPIASGETSSATSYVMYKTWGFRPVTSSDAIDLESALVDPESTGLNLMINPIINAKEELINNDYVDINANSYLSYDIAKGLTLKVTAGINSRKNEYTYFYNSRTSRGTPLNPSNFRGVYGGVVNRSYSTLLNENILTYNKRFNKDHVLNAVGGFSLQGSNNRSYGFEADHILVEELTLNALASGTPYQNTSLEGLSRLSSFFGRVNYNLKSKYLFTLTMRADGSSKFPTGKKWGYFPSGAVAWKMKEESFLKNVSVISDAKLRGSFGITGNNRIGDFDHLPRLILADYNAGYSHGNAVPTKGAIYTSLGNSLLRWESTQQTDIGLDLGFFKERIVLNADVYRKVTSDLLLSANLPRTTGFISAFKNIGEVMNKGLEISINTINIKGRDFSWESSFNISFNRNKILKLSEGEDNLQSKVNWENNYSAPMYIGKVGQPAALFYGYVFDGNYQYSDFDEVSPGKYMLKGNVTTNGESRTAIQPGDIKYKDMNGDLVVNSSDLAIIGRPQPIHTGGFSNNFNYKSFSLGVFFQWSYGNDIQNANRLIFEGNSLFRPLLNQFSTYNNRWTPENQNNELFRSDGHGPIGAYSSRTIEDGSFLRLKTVSLEYKVPTSVAKKLYMNNLAFTVSSQNLFTWTKYTGMDPEVSTRHSALTPGFDFSAYPRERTIVFGINANF